MVRALVVEMEQSVIFLPVNVNLSKKTQNRQIIVIVEMQFSRDLVKKLLQNNFHSVKME
jgi:hypothetical protein